MTCLAGCAGAQSTDPGATLLFAAATGGLSAGDRNAIFAALDLVLTPDGSGFVDGVCGHPVWPEVEFRDMNQDGVPEVFVQAGNPCTSGAAESSVILFIRDREGRYAAHLGFPGRGAIPMDSTSHGYPDLLIGGPGFCHPVLRWDGTRYAHRRDYPEAPGGCDHIGKS